MPETFYISVDLRVPIFQYKRLGYPVGFCNENFRVAGEHLREPKTKLNFRNLFVLFSKYSEEFHQLFSSQKVEIDIFG